MERALFARATLCAALALLAGCESAAQESRQTPVPAQWATQCTEWDDWDKPAPPFRIHGNAYYVGTCGIGAILVTDAAGHILLDSGTEAGARIVAANIAALGFDIGDVQLLGYSHEHFDHVGGMAYVQALSGASLVSLAAGAEVMRTGLSDPADPQHGLHDAFPATRVDVIHADGEAMAVGVSSLRAFATPGHTPGATTWQWESCDQAGDCRSIVYADSLSAVSGDEYRFSDHPAYLQAYRDGIARLAALDCDILITPHPSAGGMREKLLAGDLTSGMDCAAYAADRLAQLEARLARENGEPDV